jgi:type II secretory pathway component PulF
MVLSVSVWVVLVLLAMFVTPMFESIFINFKTELPGFTKLVLSICRWVSNDYGWLLLSPVFFALPFALIPLFRAGIAMGRQIRWRLVQRLVYTLVTLIVGAYVLAMLLPMASVIETLYGGR